MKEAKDTIFKRLYYGIIKENPILVMCLGLCPAIAVVVTAQNGLAMGGFTAVVLILSNFFISLLKKAIPEGERLLVYIIIVGCFTALTQIFLKAYYPEINEALGIFVSLTAVNTIIYYRAENYAMKANPFLSLFDGIGVGIGYAFMLTLFGAIREILGVGTIFGFRIIPDGFTFSIAALAPGAFFLLACLIALANRIGGGKKA